VNSTNHLAKIILLFLVVTVHVAGMEESCKPATNLELQILQHNNYSPQGITRIKLKGLNKTDQDLLQTATEKWKDEKETLEEFGYDFIFDEKHGKFTRRPRQWSQNDRNFLHSLDLTDSDIDQVTIANVREPLNDDLVLCAALCDKKNQFNPRTFNIFKSLLLWPDGIPSEADILLLLPHLTMRGSNGVNTHLSNGSTLLGLAARCNYQRVAKILIELYTVAPQLIRVNERVEANFSPLELAILGDHVEMVRLLLTHPAIEITKTAWELSTPRTWLQRLLISSENPKAQIKKLLKEHARNRTNRSAASAQTPVQSPTKVRGGIRMPRPGEDALETRQQIEARITKLFEEQKQRENRRTSTSASHTRAPLHSPAFQATAASDNTPLLMPRSDDVLATRALEGLIMNPPVVADTHNAPAQNIRQNWDITKWIAGSGALVAVTAVYGVLETIFSKKGAQKNPKTATQKAKAQK
jgi:hypothetical protein